MTEHQVSDLTPREQGMLSALIRQRDEYRRQHHGVAAWVLGAALRVQLRVIRSIGAGPDAEPFRSTLFRNTDDLAFRAAAIAKLPEAQRAAARMCEIDGKSVDEIAVKLGMEVGAVEALLFSARNRLRMILATAADSQGRRL